MAHAPLRTFDPSRDAASLLRRLGFGVLTLGLPLGALFARRGVVLLVPIGVALIVLAGILDGNARRIGDTAGRLTGSTAVVALVCACVWMALSLLWAPDPSAPERLVSFLATLGVALLGYVYLPDRMRASNLYLLPVGCALGALMSIGFALYTSGSPPDLDGDGRSLERGATMVALLAWPSIAWLRSRERDVEALTLGVLVAVAAVLGASQSPLPLALSVGALAFAAASLAPRPGATAVAAIIAAILVLAPLLPYGFALFPQWVGRMVAPEGSFQAWRGIVESDPVRLLPGRGIGALMFRRVTGLVPAETSATPVLSLWYDLGLIGVATAAAAIWAGLRSAVTSYAPLLPGVVAVYATVFTLASLGFGTGQAWWLNAVAIVGLIFVAIERGQFRTRRPRAILFGASRKGAGGGSTRSPRPALQQGSPQDHQRDRKVDNQPRHVDERRHEGS